MPFYEFLLCFNVIWSNYGMAIGDKTKLPRYAFDPDLKPAIIGSYSYDVVKGKFILPDTNSSTTEINLTDIILSSASNVSTGEDFYRKHVGKSETKSFKWRTVTRPGLPIQPLRYSKEVNTAKSPLI